jgi:cupin 2 domain-containing protein
MLRFEKGSLRVTLLPGDYIFIPAHERHRVEWTAEHEETVWLALHYGEDSTSQTGDSTI